MITLDLATLAAVTNGQLLCHESLKTVTIENLIIDSRLLQVKDAFLALKGPNFDGHHFAQQVVEQGCQVLIVDHQIECLNTDEVAQIIVDDTRIALGQIAAYVKQQVAPKTIGITGSSGKTTVKEMLAAILSRLGKVLATNGNFNNDIGVPLTLLRLKQADDFAVIEMGANHIDEIAYSTALVKPDVAMIINIAAAHLEGFGDLCGVARAKGEIFSGLAADGVALYNHDTKFSSKWQWRLTDKQIRTFSCADHRDEKKHRDAKKDKQIDIDNITNSLNADCYTSNVCLDVNGCASFDLQTSLGQCVITLNVPGKHNVCNAVAAATAAIECGANLDDIRLGLAEMTPVNGRLNIHHLTRENSNQKIQLIDDTYNANVESIKAAISLLANYSGIQILILGDMGELGSEARSYHQEVGSFAKEQGINVLLTLGVLSQNTSDAFARNNKTMSKHFSERTDLSVYLFSLLAQSCSQNDNDKENNKNNNNNKNHQESNINILVKGSRSAHMEKVVEDIFSWHANRFGSSVCHISEDNA